MPIEKAPNIEKPQEDINISEDIQSKKQKINKIFDTVSADQQTQDDHLVKTREESQKKLSELGESSLEQISQVSHQTADSINTLFQ